MSVDVLQERIRKTKNPSVVLFEAFPELIPQTFLEESENTARAYGKLCRRILTALKGIVPAVRFEFGSFALLGPDGLTLLAELTDQAKAMGYYVLLDTPEMLSLSAAANVAGVFSDENCPFAFDGIIFSQYPGSDILKALLPLCKKGKLLLPVVRTANKTAPEIQDLLTGARLVHTAVADVVSRSGADYVGKCGYSQVGAVAGASSADSLRTLRSKYSRMFMLLDGYDYPNANAKNCSFAFDKLGHGAIACAGSSVVGAWKEAPNADAAAAAVEAAERMKRNLTRYVTVL